MLYALGSNGTGQLGVGHTSDLSSTEPISTDNDSITKSWRVLQLAAGGNHTIILCHDAKLRATGNNEDGRCGIKGVQHASRFTEIELPIDENGRYVGVKQVTCSWSTTLLLSDSGRIYVCGTGDSGELGLGESVTKSPEWQPIPDFATRGTEVIHLASGMAHTIAVLSNGEIYGWGKGRKGQLGEPAEDVWSPRKITAVDFAAIKIACGKDFTLVVGEPSTEQIAVLGERNRDRFRLHADAPETLEDWKDVAASWCSLFSLDGTGNIVAWGRNDHGQLPPQGLPPVEAIAAGSEHCLALTRTRKVLAWGWGEHGNCGKPTDERGDAKERWNGIGVPGRVTNVFAGCATSFIETEELADDPAD